MIVVKVELWSANTGEITELGRMVVANDGSLGNGDLGSYDVWLGRKGTTDCFNIIEKPTRKGRVENHPRLRETIWSLIGKALRSIGH